MSAQANPVDALLAEPGVVVLDGGLASELEARGHDLADPLWSARLLFEAPEAVRAVHAAYLEAGADCIATASYQATLPGLEARGFTRSQAEAVLRLSVDLAREARDAFVAGAASEARGRPLVAASVGPYGAYLANGAEYTGDYDLDDAGLRRFHRARWELLANAGADLIACETLPSFREALVLAELLEASPGRGGAWFSFSCRDAEHVSDGTPLRDVVRELAARPGVVALGVNCVPPERVSASLAIARAETSLPLVAYPNSGEGWDARRRCWTGARGEDFVELATTWRSQGARLIGGCCRTGPRDVQRLRARLLGAEPERDR